MDDFVVIGSGFGGSVAAAELCAAGARVTLLERGPWRDTLPLRSAGVPSRAPLPAGWRLATHALFRVHHRRLPGGSLTLNRDGLLEAHLGSDIGVVCSSGVGGNSHVYSALHARPLRTDYWDGVADGIDRQSMEQHYEAALELLDSRFPAAPDPRTFPPAPWESASAPFVDVSGDQALRWGYLFPQVAGECREVSWRGVTRRETDFRQEGMFGSPQGGKTTLDFACLLPAMRRGLVVRERCEAQSLRRERNGGFEIGFRDGDGRQRTLRAARVIVAAGTLNTLRLLLRSRAAGGLGPMPALGTGFGSNGDVAAAYPVAVPGVDYAAAGVYTRLFRHRDDVHGPIFLQAGRGGLDAMPIGKRARERQRGNLFIAGMGIDAADGRVSWAGGRLRIDYAASASPVFQRIHEHLATLGRLGGLAPRPLSGLLTVHPVGGARVGRSLRDSVLDARGEVHDVPGLFVTDASALPAAPGSPPSLSVAAWSRHVARGCVR